MALDPQTGDLINANFISIANLPSGVKPHALLHSDGQRVLVSHQIQDVVYAYDLNGNFLGVFAPAGGPNTAIMDNIRGMAFHPTTGNFLVTSAAGGNTNAVVEFDLEGQFLGTFIAPGAGGIVGPWSILFRGSDVLVSASGDNIYSYLHNGTPIGRWNVEDINFPEQITQAANTDILAAAFSSPSGVHEFTAAGNRIAIYNPVTGNRGVYELPNGNILTSNSAGVHEITRNNTLVRTIIAGSSYMISLAQFGPTPTPTPTPTATPTSTPTPTPSCTPGWSAGPDMPSVAVRSVGVYFPANGKFYAMGGRSSDAAGSDFTHPFEYDPATNAWTTKAATYADNQVNNMACGVLTDAGTPYIYCVGGSAAGATTSTDRVFRYNPVTDTISPVAAPWPGALAGTTLPGGFTIFQNKLYILGGFTISPAAATNTIWEFTPRQRLGSKGRCPACGARAIYRRPPSAPSSTPVVARMFRPACSSMRPIRLFITRWLILSSPLPAYPGPQARRERSTSITRCG